MCQKEYQEKCQIERLFWTVSIELQAPRRLKTDVAAAILALEWEQSPGA